MVLLQVRLEGRGAGVGGLVSKSSASSGHEVIVVLGDSALALLHAPEDEGDTAEQKSTTDATDNATDDLLVALAQAATVTARAADGLGGVGYGCLTGGLDKSAGACRGHRRSLAVDDCAEDGGVKLDRGGDKGSGAHERSGPERRGSCWGA